MRPLCFVLMPFGTKPNSDGQMVDFDAVYRDLIRPSVEAAGLEPLRADEEMTGGLIHKPMFERLILCEFAVADLTTANANVFYELGVRHAVRPHATVSIYAGTTRLPFDVAPLRALPYGLTARGTPDAVEEARAQLTERLRLARTSPAHDSPVFQLVEDFPDVDHARTDVFRDLVAYSAAMKRRLAEARDTGAEAVRQVALELGDVADREAGVVIDLFLSYRAVEEWEEMVSLAGRMAPPLRQTVLVQEQVALALNRLGRSEEAERVIRDTIERWGPSSESYGILGRVYKDRWAAAREKGSAALARGLLDRAIEAYRLGFETDWRDAYPGVNAVTLMQLREPPSPELEKLLPVVRYAVERRIARGQPDYWDHATLLELAVLGDEQEAAFSALADALAVVRERWEPRTTARNLRLIRESREGRGRPGAWIAEIEEELEQAAVAREAAR